jgi:hypothetical protein
MSFPGCFGPWMTTDIIMNFTSCTTKEEGYGYIELHDMCYDCSSAPQKDSCHLYIDQTLSSLHHQQSLGSLSRFFPLRPISGVSQHLVFLTVFFVPLQQPNILFVSEQIFQPWYYRSIPHNLGRNPIPGGLALNITRVISSDLIPHAAHTRHASKFSYSSLR